MHKGLLCYIPDLDDIVKSGIFEKISLKVFSSFEIHPKLMSQK